MMSLGPKDGGPNAKFFELPEILVHMDSIRNWLLKNAKKVSIIKKIFVAL